MTPRARPLTAGEAAVGAAAVGILLAVTIALSHLLEPPQIAPELPAALDASTGQRDLAASCPSPADLARRGPVITVTSAELMNCPREFDGASVSFSGEAVGAVLRRGAQAWVHLNDDHYARSDGPLPEHRTSLGGNAGMAVLVPSSATLDVTPGHFRRRGTALEVTGIFRRSHPADDGGPAIEADNVRLLAAASTIPRQLSAARLLVAAVLAAVTAALGLRWRRLLRG